MSHNTLISGTSYKIIGGNALIGGTEYKVTSGNTLIGGTSYKIPFENKFVKLMSDAVVPNGMEGDDLTDGRNGSSSATVRLRIYYQRNEDANIFPLYVFMFSGETANTSTWNPRPTQSRLSVYRIDSVGTGSSDFPSPTLVYSYSDDGQIMQFYVSHSRYYVQLQASLNGTSAGSFYGATMVGVMFPNYSVAEADSIISSINIIDHISRNSSSTDLVSLYTDADSIILAACTASMALSYPIGTTIFTNDTGYTPSLVEYYTGTEQLRLRYNSNSYIYGGSILKLAK